MSGRSWRCSSTCARRPVPRPRSTRSSGWPCAGRTAARRAVRQGDVVGHLGAGRFALLFPRAGTFEARAAYKRVRDAVGVLEVDGDGLACGAAGFAELDEDGSGDLLADALVRLQAARVKQAYTGPIGPGTPSTPLAG